MRILVAVDVRKDDGREAARLVEAAAKWAGGLHAAMDVLYVDEALAAEPFAHAVQTQTPIAIELTRLMDADRDATSRLLDDLPADVRGDAHVGVGRAAAEVVAFAPRYELVVVGTHGRRGVQHLFLGSVAERIVRTSPVPVLVLPVERQGTAGAA